MAENNTNNNTNNQQGWFQKNWKWVAGAGAAVVVAGAGAAYFICKGDDKGAEALGAIATKAIDNIKF